MVTWSPPGDGFGHDGMLLKVLTVEGNDPQGPLLGAAASMHGGIMRPVKWCLFSYLHALSSPPGGKEKKPVIAVLGLKSCSTTSFPDFKWSRTRRWTGNERGAATPFIRTPYKAIACGCLAASNQIVCDAIPLLTHIPSASVPRPLLLLTRDRDKARRVVFLFSISLSCAESCDYAYRKDCGNFWQRRRLLGGLCQH